MDMDDTPDHVPTADQPNDGADAAPDGAADAADVPRLELLGQTWLGPGMVDEEFEDVGTDADA